MEVLERYETGVIALVDISKLHDHEKIKQEYLKELIEIIRKDGVLKVPIVVDKHSNIVLDGHHRFFACKALGCKRISAYMVDYYNPSIKVDTWHPLIKTKTEVKAIFKSLNKMGFLTKEVRSEKAVKVLVESGQACAGMVIKNDSEEFYIVQNQGKTFKEVMDCIQSGLATEGLRKELDYVGEKEVEAVLKKKQASMVIVVPKVTKEKVVEMGVSGQTFPAKTTRHIIPGKASYPISLDVLKKSEGI